jgi:formylglycine-generating enzyme required for sulfatase activity
MQLFDSGEHMENGNAFEELLKDSFLELDFDQPENEAMIQALSDSVMCSNSFQTAKSRNSIKQLLSKISLQSVLWITAGIIISILAIYFFKKQPSSNLKTATERTTISKIETAEMLNEEKQNGLDEIINLPEDQVQQINPLATAILAADTILNSVVPDEVQPEKIQEKVTETTEDEVTQETKDEQPYVFPTLTDKEIRANEKQKKKMSDQLIKLSKNLYPFIPKGSMTYKSAVSTSGGFYMQHHEVTNLEYRTFLFDLLIQDRKDEFLIAKPEQSQWINSNNTGVFDQMKDTYFSDKTYNEYPVVNITIEGAKLYCKWLNEIMMGRPDRQQDCEARIPTEIEWIYAAKGKLNGSYPWGTDSIQNKNNAFLANFNVQLLKEHFSQPFKYTTKFGKPFTLSYTACTSAGLVLNKDTVATVGVAEYNPNWYGLYCMSGNAAEWTLSNDGKLAKPLGGSWGSDFEHLKLTGENEYPGKKSSPFIGFRFIIVPVPE